MSHNQPDTSGGQETSGQEDHLRIGDIVRYLSRLASLHKEPRIGNSELSHGLQQLATALRPHSKRPIREIADAVSEGLPSKRTGDSSKRPKAELPPDLETVSAKTIEDILGDRTYMKLQLIDLGVKRFGISRSKLMRLNRDHILESIRAALNHEQSIGAISEEARRGGEKRSS